MLGGSGMDVCTGEEDAGVSSSNTNGLGPRKNARKQLDLATMFRRYTNIILLLHSLYKFILVLDFSRSAQKRPSKEKEEEKSNGVDHSESNEDIEPAAKRPKHESTNGVTEDESRDQSSSENNVKTEPPKKEVVELFLHNNVSSMLCNVAIIPPPATKTVPRVQAVSR